MNKEKLRKWIEETEKNNYIDCTKDCWEAEEFDFILNMAKELLKRLEKEK